MLPTYIGGQAVDLKYRQCITQTPHWADKQAGVTRCLTALILALSFHLLCIWTHQMSCCVRWMNSVSALLSHGQQGSSSLGSHLYHAHQSLQFAWPAHIEQQVNKQSLKACKLSEPTRHGLLNVFPEHKACMLTHNTQKLYSLML